MKSATAHGTGVSHRVHDAVPSPGVYSTRVRKPKRRTMASTPLPRGRTRAAELRDRSARDTPPATPAEALNTPNSKSDDSTSAAPQQHPNSKDKTNTQHAPAIKPAPKNDKSPPSDPDPAKSAPTSAEPPSRPLKPNVWCYDDVHAIAARVHSANTIDPHQLFGGSDPTLPEQLKRKSVSDVTQAVVSLKGCFDSAVSPFAVSPSLPNFMAVLASEMHYMKTQKEQRDSALAVLNKARSERQQVERNREKLLNESKALSRQVQEERTRRARAVDKKAQADKKLEEEKRKVEDEREHYAVLRENLEKAKLSELDIRRRLDRMRLKVAAMRGEMIIPTVDKLSRPVPKWLGELDESVTSAESDPQETPRDKNAMAKQSIPKPDVEMTVVPPTEDIESPTHSASKDELELDESAEEIEFRLLKNRLAMCEMEAHEWRDCLKAEREKVRLILLSKSRLEEELARQKQGGSSKAGGSSSGRGVGKGAAGHARATAKLRAAVRASLPVVADVNPRKSIRKTRKGRPRRALMPEPL